MENKEGSESRYLKISKIDGEKFTRFLKNRVKREPIIDAKRKVLYEGQFILFPINEDNEIMSNFLQEMEDKIQHQMVSRKSVFNSNYKFKTLQEGVSKIIPEKYVKIVPSSYDIIGSIIIIEFDRIGQIAEQDQEFFKQQVAKKLIEKHKNVETVYEKSGKVKGRYRLRELNLVWGKDNPETIYKENACLFKLDVKNTYFNPRLNHERQRIASQNFSKNEIIVDMFAGVGPFSIQIAHKHEVNIHAFDINPHAYKYLVENVSLNPLQGKISPHNLDIKDLLSSTSDIGLALKNKTDRIIMNLPESSLDYMEVACLLLKEGGIIYNYQICDKPQSIRKAIHRFEKVVKQKGWKINRIHDKRIVKQYSPKADLIVLDVSLNPVNA